MAKTKQKKEVIPIEKKLDPKTILITAFIEGFVLIFIEILSAKILNAYFGASLKVWSVILSCTLLFISLGYYYGGKISIASSRKKLIRIIQLASFSMVFTLLIANSILSVVSESELFTALIISSILLMGLPLFLLGCISPTLIQLNMSDEKDLVSVSGKIYFYSTIGGIMACFILGFISLELIGISANQILASLMLFGVSIYIDGFNRKNNILLAALLFLNIISYSRINGKSDESSQVIFNSEGVMGQLKVVDYPLKDGAYNSRMLMINGINQTKIINIPDAFTLWNYPHLISYLSHIKPKESSTLILGLGGGSVVNELKKRFNKIDVVEIDPRITEIAQKYFYLSPSNLNFTTDDARNYLRKTPKKYDLVVYDLLTGETQPNYVFTVEALGELKKTLNKNAAIIVNYQGIAQGEGDLAFRTLYKTFQHAGFQVNFKSQYKSKFGDIVFVLTQTKPDYSQVKFKDLNICCRKAKNMQNIEKENLSTYIPSLNDISVLVDDKPVLELLNSHSIYEWRQSMRNGTSNDLLKGGNSIFN